MNYLPSLEERKKRFLESCCGGSDMGSDMGGLDSEAAYTGDMTDPEPVSKLDKFIKKRKRKK